MAKFFYWLKTVADL